jgi:hypothetical protein
MAVKISIPKKLEAKLRELALNGPVMEHAGTTVRQLLSVLDDAHDKLTKKAENGGLDPNDVIRAVKGILGAKVYCPPNPGAAFYGFVKKRTQFLNVSLQDIEAAAQHVRAGSKVMRLPSSMEWFIKKLDQVMEEMAGAEPDFSIPEEEQPETCITGRG